VFSLEHYASSPGIFLTDGLPTGNMTSTMTVIESRGSTGRGENVRDKLLRAGPVLAIAVAIAALGTRFFLVIWKYSVNVFFYDQWEYMTPFFRHRPSIRELFFLEPAGGPIREGLGLLPDKYLYPLTHWNVRGDAFIVGGSILAAMLLALLLKRKLYGPLSYSDIAIPVIFLTLQQYEAMVGTPNPGYSGLPLLMMMLYCLALLIRNRLLGYSLIFVLNILLIYTGWGFFMGVVTIGVFLLQCYWSWRHLTSVPLAHSLTGLLVAAASFASFFIHYTFFSGVDCLAIPYSQFLQYPQFVSLMFSAFVVPRPLHVSAAMTALGAAILLGVIAIFVWHIRHLLKGPRQDAHLIGAVLLSYSLLFSTNAAIGRVCATMKLAYSSRYVTLLIPAFLAIYFYLLSKSWHGKRNLVLTLWVVLLLPASVRKPWEDIRWYSSGKRDWANCYVRMENIHLCDQVANFTADPYPGQPGFQEKLDYLKLHQLSLFYEPAPK
jgi:hypothetical protein